MAAPEQYTASGLEIQFATNYVGHFALACSLRKYLADARSARIVCVSSTGHLRSPVVFDDIDYAFRSYEPWGAYGQSKAAVNLFAVGASAHWKQYGITANAEQGAATSVFLAASPLVEGVGGKYFNDCNEATPVGRRPRDPATMSRSVAAYSLVPANADLLWDKSVDILKRELPPSVIAGWCDGIDRNCATEVREVTHSRRALC
jgi:NAD(P)-dependent dehydrogenase (short-subunit alcohol dehydrogenase family)